MLNPSERKLRLAFDYKVMREVEARSDLLRFSAFKTIDDVHANRRQILTHEDATDARYYVVSFLVPTLKGPGEILGRTDVQFDLSNQAYPYTEPHATVMSTPKPWSPHFHSAGAICTGQYWQKQGKMLLAHLVLHICRLLNFDEVPQGSGYIGYNGQAVDYWRKKMNYGPVTPGLAYPPLPTELLYDTTAASNPVFGPKQTVFAAKAPAVAAVSGNGAFRPKRGT